MHHARSMSRLWRVSLSMPANRHLTTSLSHLPLPEPTKRLEFRWWQADDGDRAFALWGDAEVNTWLGAMNGADRKATDARLLMEMQCTFTDHAQYWPCFTHDDGGHVGAVGLRRKGERCWELGVHLRREYWGRGLASEAAAAVANFGFDALEAESLFGGHHPDNTGSARMLTGLGFTYTHDGLFDGLPDRCYTLTREMWNARSK